MENKIKTLIFTCPLPALSSNQAYTGRRWKTPKYKQFCKDMQSYYVAHKLTNTDITGDIAIRYDFYLKYAKSTDWDNLIKPLQDTLVANGILGDDRFIWHSTVVKHKSKGNSFTVSISKYEEEKDGRI